MITDSLVTYCRVFHPKIKVLLDDGVIKPTEVQILISRAYPRHAEASERQRRYTLNAGVRNGESHSVISHNYKQLSLEL